MSHNLIGGQGEINVVILLKCYNRKAGVAGKVQVWRLDAAEAPRKDQEEIICTTPASPQASIIISRVARSGKMEDGPLEMLWI